MNVYIRIYSRLAGNCLVGGRCGVGLCCSAFGFCGAGGQFCGTAAVYPNRDCRLVGCAAGYCCSPYG